MLADDTALTPTGALDRDRWNQLAGSFYLCWPWLAALERGLELRGSLLSVGDPPTAAIPAYSFPQAPANPRYDLRRFADITKSPAESWGPQLLLGGVAGYSNGVLLDRSTVDDERRAALHLLAGAIEQAAAGHASAAVSYLDAVDADILRAGLPGWHPVLEDVEVSVPIVGETFQEWVSSLPASRRSVVRRDLGRRHGELSTVDVREVPPDAARLMVAVQERHGEPAVVDAFEAFLRRCGWIAEQGVDCPAFLCRQPDGALRAVGLGFVWGDTLFIRAVGLDYPAIEGDSDYFQVLCYEPVRYAIAHQLRRVHLGIGGLRTKLLRGGRVNPLWTLLRPPATVRPGRSFRAANDARLAALRADLGGLLGDTGGPQWTLADGR